MEELLLKNQLCARLYKSSRTMIRLYQPFLDELGLTYPQYLVMLVIWEYETIDFKQLSQLLELKTGTLTPIVQKLELLGYVNKHKNSTDSRKVNLTLTDHGLLLRNNASEIPMKLANEIGITNESYQRYIHLLDELGELLDEAEKKQKG